MTRPLCTLLIIAGLAIAGWYGWTYWEFVDGQAADVSLQVMRGNSKGPLAGLPPTSDLLLQHHRTVFIECLLKGMVGVLMVIVGLFVLSRTRSEPSGDDAQ